MKSEMIPKPNNIKSEDGFTLIEILMAILLFSIIGVIMAGSFISGTRLKGSQEDVVEIQQNIRVAFHILARDLRMAGYEIAPNWDASLIRTANQITGNNQTINFSYIVNDNRLDVNGDGLPDTGQLANLAYSIVGTNLIRNDGTNQIPVATNINAVSFAFLDNTGAWTNAPPVDSTTTRAIGITVIAQSARPDSDLPSVARPFTDPFLNGNPVIYTSPADQFRRRVGSTVVNLRNFGI